MNFRSSKQSYELTADADEHLRRAIRFTALSGAIGAVAQTDWAQQAVREENIIAAAIVGAGLGIVNVIRGNPIVGGLFGIASGGLGVLAPRPELVQQIVQEDNLVAAASVSLAVAGVSGVMAAVRGAQGEFYFWQDMRDIEADRQHRRDMNQSADQEKCMLEG